MSGDGSGGGVSGDGEREAARMVTADVADGGGFGSVSFLSCSGEVGRDGRNSGSREVTAVMGVVVASSEGSDWPCRVAESAIQRIAML